MNNMLFARSHLLPISLITAAITSLLVPPASRADTGTTSLPTGTLPVYPDDAYSEPADDRWHCFETTCGILLPGNAPQRPAQWHRNELLSVERDGVRQTHWRFNRKKGVATAASLGFTDNIRRAPESVSFHVRNNSAKPVSFHAILYELAWNKADETEKRYLEWGAPISESVAPGAEAEIALPLSAMTSAQPAERKTPWFPARMTIVADGVDDETEYDLLLSKLTFHYSPAHGVSGVSVSGPRTARTSETVSFVVAASGVRAESVVDLELRGEPWVLGRMRLSADEKNTLCRAGKVRITRPIPWYLAPRAYTVGLVVDGYRAQVAETRIEVLNHQRPALAKVERRTHRGRPTFFVNGKPLTWSGYASYDYRPGNVAEFGASGADMFVVPTDAGRHVHQVAAPTWRNWDTYEFGELDERVAMGLQANPKSFITLRVSLALPPFWLQEHKDSTALIRTPQGDSPWEETGAVAVSLASDAWREQQAMCLRELIDHCKSQPWANRVVAVILAGEVTEEWFMWGCNDGQYADYSAPFTGAYSSWRRDHGLLDAPIPSPEDRNRTGYDIYPADPAGRNSAAYAQFCSDRTAETIEYFAKVVKDATGGRTLVGVFYGYVLQLAGESRQHTSGHFALTKVLACPDVDYLLGIPLHNFRLYKDGYDVYTTAVESVFAHGKGYANENDLFSWLHNGPWYTEYDPKDPRAGAVRMHQRVLADDMVHGASRQWFSLLTNWHHDAGLQQEFARQIALNHSGVKYDRTASEEIAFVVDDTSFAWAPPGTELPRTANVAFLYALARTGAPVGVWLLSDVDRIPERIRMVVIAHAPAARPLDLEKLKAVLARGGRTVVLCGPVGLVNPDANDWDLGATRVLTGLPVKVEDIASTGTAQLASNGKEITHAESMRPRAYVEGNGWLRYADGKTAGADRPLPNGGRLIWCGVPPQDSALLREWVEAAGAHCYAPIGFTVHASRQLVGITASSAGETQLIWPHAVSAKDLLDGWSGKGSAMSCPFEAGQTRLFSISRK
ncbi:MAG: hypothetical protein HZB26_19620 [Candidatus Hydrogenedentes bacterium]|nr:hypothetical protein [Candidatus Hydrogenedentota bacterium]